MYYILYISYYYNIFQIIKELNNLENKIILLLNKYNLNKSINDKKFKLMENNVIIIINIYIHREIIRIRFVCAIPIMNGCLINTERIIFFTSTRGTRFSRRKSCTERII